MEHAGSRGARVPRIESMAAPRSEARRWADRAARALSDAGYRRGGARRAILDLLDEQRCALSAAEIQAELASRRREVSRASVYRVMDELEEIGLLQRVEVGHGVVRYEPARGASEHHHHLVCDCCGRVSPFSDDGLERAIRRVSETLPVRVSEHEVVIHGACETCSSPR
jgi:Fur family transcriptional regulator, ferric uptake regulator